MPDATHGVPVSYSHHLGPDAAYHATSPDCRGTGCKPGTWYPADEAAARDAVIEAAREYREWDGNREGKPNREGVYFDTRRLIETRADLDSALDRLDEIRNDKEKER